jgi:hypothetical protein
MAGEKSKYMNWGEKAMWAKLKDEHSYDEAFYQELQAEFPNKEGKADRLRELRLQLAIIENGLSDDEETVESYTAVTLHEYLSENFGLSKNLVWIMDTAGVEGAERNVLQPLTPEQVKLVLAVVSQETVDNGEKSEEGPLPEEEEGTPSAPEGGMLSKFEQAETVGLTKKVMVGWLEGADKKELRRAGHFWFGLDPANSPRSLRQNMTAKVKNWATDPTGFELDKLPDFSDEMWKAIDVEVKKRIEAAKERKIALEEEKKSRKKAPSTIELPAELPEQLDPPDWESSMGFEKKEEIQEGDTQPTLVRTEEVIEISPEKILDEGEIEENIPDEPEIEEEPQPEDGQPETELAVTAEIVETEEPKMSEGSKVFMIISLIVAGIFSAACLGVILAVFVISITQ